MRKMNQTLNAQRSRLNAQFSQASQLDFGRFLAVPL